MRTGAASKKKPPEIWSFRDFWFFGVFFRFRASIFFCATLRRPAETLNQGTHLHEPFLKKFWEIHSIAAARARRPEIQIFRRFFDFSQKNQNFGLARRFSKAPTTENDAQLRKLTSPTQKGYFV